MLVSVKPALKSLSLTHLWTDKKNATVETDNPAVVVHTAVCNREADIQENVVAALIFKDPSQHLQRVQVEIRLEKVVIARITRDL